jgi:hypothetical protein
MQLMFLLEVAEQVFIQVHLALLQVGMLLAINMKLVKEFIILQKLLMQF